MRGTIPAVGIRDRLPRRVTIVEVSPRDGLQAEERVLPAETKIALIERLADAGHTVIETTSFVSPKAVPQLADADELFKRLRQRPGVRYPVLVPNERGLERAIAAGANEIAIVASASESYSRRNLGRSRAEAMEMLQPLTRRAKDQGMRMRAYLSMAFADPWDGPTPLNVAVDAGRALLDLGADELSIGDTIGAATPGKVQDLVDAYLASGVPAERLAVHFHDTYGQGLANVLAAMELGVSIVDASAGGLGGSPYAKGAAGNLATEDLVWMLEGLGIRTGIDVRALAATALWICGELGRETPGRAARALAPPPA